jgi:hypothetical protein
VERIFHRKTSNNSPAFFESKFISRHFKGHIMVNYESPLENRHVPVEGTELNGNHLDRESSEYEPITTQPALNGFTLNGDIHQVNGHTSNEGPGTHMNGDTPIPEPLNEHAPGEESLTNGANLNGFDSHSNEQAADTSNGFTEAQPRTSPRAETRPNAGMPIAVVGISVRAGATSSPDEFFKMLSRGRNSFKSSIPPERFNNASFYHPHAGKLGCINTNGASFIEQDVTKFDAPFFSITELEAKSMDPQQRILLECAFEALESAGVQKHTTVGKDIGVFIGAGAPEYEFDLFRDSETMPMFQATGRTVEILNYESR